MITEQYVEFSTAKLLKEKGFDVSVGTYKDDFIQHGEIIVSRNECLSKDCYPTPTQQMTMRWLREEKHFYIQIMLDSWALGGHSGYYIVIQDINSEFKEISPIIDDNPDLVFFETYEQAAESAIKYCLENLI